MTRCRAAKQDNLDQENSSALRAARRPDVCAKQIACLSVTQHGAL